METSRREFIKTSSKALVGLGAAVALPLETLAQAKKLISPADKLNIAAIGINGMGWSDVRSLMKIPEVNVVALCDVDENVLNFRKYELAKAGIKTQTYVDYRKLLESKDIDAVVIGSPDHWHCLQMVDACSAGKDVYVEKPVGNSVQ
jgi:predicted dehydrogenase